MIFRLIQALGSNPGSEIFAALIGVILAMLLALCVHEWGHAVAAYKSGDMTAKNMGRLTLNPAKHLDLIGTLLLIFGGFGWAKPVPVNPNNFTHPKKGMFWTAVAGVITNYAMAFVSYGLLQLLYLTTPPANVLQHLWTLLDYFLFYMFIINITLFLFNLLPIFPLDGFRLLETLSRPGNRAVEWLRKNGTYLLIGLLLLGYVAEMISPWLDILGVYLNYGSVVAGWPITAFWGLFF